MDIKPGDTVPEEIAALYEGRKAFPRGATLLDNEGREGTVAADPGGRARIVLRYADGTELFVHPHAIPDCRQAQALGDYRDGCGKCGRPGPLLWDHTDKGRNCERCHSEPGDGYWAAQREREAAAQAPTFADVFKATIGVLTVPRNGILTVTIPRDEPMHEIHKALRTARDVLTAKLGFEPPIMVLPEGMELGVVEFADVKTIDSIVASDEDGKPTVTVRVDRDEPTTAELARRVWLELGEYHWGDFAELGDKLRRAGFEELAAWLGDIPGDDYGSGRDLTRADVEELAEELLTEPNRSDVDPRRFAAAIAALVDNGSIVIGTRGAPLSSGTDLDREAQVSGLTRGFVALKPGEEWPPSLRGPTPDGMRWETDGELRARVWAALPEDVEADDRRIVTIRRTPVSDITVTITADNRIEAVTDEDGYGATLTIIEADAALGADHGTILVPVGDALVPHQPGVLGEESDNGE